MKDNQLSVNLYSVKKKKIDGETVRNFVLGAQKSLQMVIATMKLQDACSLEEKL